MPSIEESFTASAIQRLSISPRSFASPEASPFDVFSKRRAYIEQAALLTPRHAEKIAVGNGGEVRVVSSLIDISDINTSLSKESSIPLAEHKTLRVSVMNAGLFEATSEFGFGEGQANTGNTEINLASGLFVGEDGFIPDAIIFIKPEGLNVQAYEHGQRLIGEASAQKIQALMADYKHTHGVKETTPVQFDLTGYSEGSTQVLSLAAALDRKKIGSIRRVLSIGGAGFVGAETGDAAQPVSFVIRAMQEAQHAKKSDIPYGPYNTETQGIKIDEKVVVPDIHVSNRPIKTLRERLTQYPTDIPPLPIQKDGTKTERIVFTDDAKNILRFGERLLKTAIGKAKDGETIPWRRIKEACAINDDAAYIAKQGIPTMVFTDYDDPFFPPRLIQEHIQTLRDQEPKANMWFIASPLGHYGPHYEQTTFSWLIDTLQHAWDSKMKTTVTGTSK